MKIDSSSDEKVGQINGFKLLLSAWLQNTIRIVNYYPDIWIIRISVSALVTDVCLRCGDERIYRRSFFSEFAFLLERRSMPGTKLYVGGCTNSW